MLGYVADTTQHAADAFFPGYAKAITDVGKERGWPPMTRASFDAQRGPNGALLVGSPDEVVDKILRHNEALGGIVRLSFMMNVASLRRDALLRRFAQPPRDKARARDRSPRDRVGRAGRTLIVLLFGECVC